MILCVWRVSGPDFDVDAFLAANPRVRPERVWHRGERWLRRGTADSSGFNETVGEAKTAQEVLVGLRERGFEVLARGARDAAADSELDFGLYPSVSRPVAGVLLAPEDLRYCADLGLSVAVSAYAVGDA